MQTRKRNFEEPMYADASLPNQIAQAMAYIRNPDNNTRERTEQNMLLARMCIGDTPFSTSNWFFNLHDYTVATGAMLQRSHAVDDPDILFHELCEEILYSEIGATPCYAVRIMFRKARKGFEARMLGGLSKLKYSYGIWICLVLMHRNLEMAQFLLEQYLSERVLYRNRHPDADSDDSGGSDDSDNSDSSDSSDNEDDEDDSEDRVKARMRVTVFRYITHMFFLDIQAEMDSSHRNRTLALAKQSIRDKVQRALDSWMEQPNLNVGIYADDDDAETNASTNLYIFNVLYAIQNCGQGVARFFLQHPDYKDNMRNFCLIRSRDINTLVITDSIRKHRDILINEGLEENEDDERTAQLVDLFLALFILPFNRSLWQLNALQTLVDEALVNSEDEPLYPEEASARLMDGLAAVRESIKTELVHIMLYMQRSQVFIPNDLIDLFGRLNTQ